MESLKGKTFTKEELELQGIRSTNIRYAGYIVYARKEERYLCRELPENKVEIGIQYKKNGVA
jgi:hypothetical protein